MIAGAGRNVEEKGGTEPPGGCVASGTFGKRLLG
jgi:hypothetical protein